MLQVEEFNEYEILNIKDISITINLQVSLEDNELLIKNLYNSKLYTPSSSLKLSLKEKANILSNKSNITIKDITVTDNPILIIKSHDSNKETEIQLMMIKSKEELLNDFNNNKQRLSLCGVNIEKENLLMYSNITELKSNIDNSIRLLENKNKDTTYDFMNIQKEIINEIEKLYEKFTQVIKDKKYEIDLDNKKKILEAIENKSSCMLKHLDASKPIRETTDFDIQYEDFEGQEYYCIGEANGCTNRASQIYGSNPYSTDSPICLAARHSGIIDENGGYFFVRDIGNFTGFIPSTNNNITSLSWNTWGAWSFHKSYIDVYDQIEYYTCGKVNNIN